MGLPSLSWPPARESPSAADGMTLSPAQASLLGCQCAQSPPPELLTGIRQFNAGEFWECHETLEEIWRREAGPVRELYRGILQVGVGFLHLRRANYRGSLSLLGRGLRRLEPLPAVCQGVDVADLRARTRWCLEKLLELGPERVRDFRPEWVPRVRTVGPAATAE